MNIVCLGWGSLIWQPGILPIAGEWCADGPQVRIEFSRIGDGGELSTAVCLNAPEVPVYWARLSVSGLKEACEALRQREQIPDSRQDGIGILPVTDAPAGSLSAWAQDKAIDAIIWTALPPRIAHTEGRIPTMEETLTYLQGLSGETREHAQGYIRQVPAQIDTPYRRAIAQALGWH
ncbi:hypothetical protein [[Erwinia] mediterraneensis]|uniref:hypothetical protein n=1 Tax=[Erwinia] mediterraneensis TaxID=2161819 RepID=UPI0010318312|nr:hypothetical protein [[Erwinia] mediterraneensis]